MESPTKYFPCDGCGLPATPEHIAARIHRLELATRFRPVHIGILFVALAPPIRLEDDFYDSPPSNELFASFMGALEISAPPAEVTPELSREATDTYTLSEFQKRGYCLAYLSECPVSGQEEPAAIPRLGPNLVRRIRFNYKPKYVALLGQDLQPLVELLGSQGIGPALILNEGQPLPFPGTGGQDWKALFQRSVASVSPS